MPDTRALQLGRLSVAAVWLYQGLALKVFGDTSRHTQIVGAAFRNPEMVRVTVLALGLCEAGLGFWFLSQRAPRACALVQTLLLVGMNAGGLLFARDQIPDPAGMVLLNFSFLVLVWWSATEGGPSHVPAK